MTRLFTFTDIVAFVALLVSAYVAWKTNTFNERQKSLIESQERLNKLLLEREKGDLASNKVANLGARIIALGSNKHRLKIWNQGRSPAFNVTISFPDGNDLVDERETADLFPLERLDPHDSVDLVAFVSMDTKRKQKMRLNWDDASSSSKEKTVYLTI